MALLCRVVEQARDLMWPSNQRSTIQVLYGKNLGQKFNHAQNWPHNNALRHQLLLAIQQRSNDRHGTAYRVKAITGSSN